MEPSGSAKGAQNVHAAWRMEARTTGAGELDVTASNFLVSSIDRFVDDVVLGSSTDPVRHMRLAAVQRSRAR